MRAVLLSSLFVVAAAVAACSATGGPAQFTSGAGGAGSAGSNGSTGGGTNLGGGFATVATGAGSGGGQSGCSAAAELVYVFGLDDNIYSFDPPSKVFTQVATPDCPTTGQPNSMAIDRDLVAWLNYFDFNGGGIYTFDLKKGTGCQLAIDLPPGFTQIGMGFSSDAVGSTAETLYVDGIGGGGLARVDMATMSLVTIGAFGNDPNLTGQSAELTGTGDAKLYGYFTTFPNVRVAQVDKLTGNILSDNELPGVAPPSDWAFSFWGGDFYLYAAPGSNTSGNSSVIHYNPTTSLVEPTYVADVGFAIIGAGVSTCAPVKPPN